MHLVRDSVLKDRYDFREFWKVLLKDYFVWKYFAVWSMTPQLLYRLHQDPILLGVEIKLAGSYLEYIAKGKTLYILGLGFLYAACSLTLVELKSGRDGP